MKTKLPLDKLSEGGVPRNELFITTKIWIENLSKDKLIPSLKESLKNCVLTTWI